MHTKNLHYKTHEKFKINAPKKYKKNAQNTQKLQKSHQKCQKMIYRG